MSSKALLKNTIIILIISVIAKICSFLWEAILAAKLGASAQADALYMVLGIFNIIFPILDIGIWKVFLPIYKQKMVKDGDIKADQFTNKFETVFLLLSIALVLFIVFLAKPIVYIVAPGFSAELKGLTIYYLKLTAPMYLLMASSSVVGAILQCHGKFLGSQLREVSSHLSKILFFLICYRYLGIYAAILSYIIGSIFRLILQIPFIDWGYKFKFDFHLKDENIIKSLKSLPSVAITAAILHVNSLVDKIIASGAAEGAISCLNYGSKLVNVFSGMITTALATAVYPNMAEYVAKNESKKLEKELIKTIELSIITIVPITVFCFLFSNEIVTLAFQRGKFGVESALLTGEIFKYYSIGMLFTGLTTIVTNVFYAYGDTRKTLVISILNVIMNIILNLILYKYLGVIGLALATSISTIICFIIRIKCLKKFIIIDYSSILPESLKIVIASLISCVIPFIVFNNFMSLALLLKVVISALLAFLLFIGCSYLLRIKTFYSLIDIIKGFAHRKKKS